MLLLVTMLTKFVCFVQNALPDIGTGVCIRVLPFHPLVVTSEWSAAYCSLHSPVSTRRLWRFCSEQEGARVRVV